VAKRDTDLQGEIEMGSTRRNFTSEYKAEAVQFVITSGQPIAEVARNLGIVEGTLGNWVAKARENGEFKERPLELSERAELERVRKELQQVKMERDFLKKAAAFFASQNP
jgi:transposase